MWKMWVKSTVQLVSRDVDIIARIELIDRYSRPAHMFTTSARAS